MNSKRNLGVFLCLLLPSALVGCQKYRVTPALSLGAEIAVSSNTVASDETVDVTATASSQVSVTFPPPSQTYLQQAGICVYMGKRELDDTNPVECRNQEQLPQGVVFDKNTNSNTIIKVTAAPGEITVTKHQATLKFTTPGTYSVIGYKATTGIDAREEDLFPTSKTEPQIITVN